MSKRTQTKQASRQNTVIGIGVGIGLVVIAAIVFLASRGAAPTGTQMLLPTEYQTQFIASNTSHLLVDVRTPEEFASGHIHNAVNIPLDSLGSRLGEVPQNQPIVVYCRSGNRSAQASNLLQQAGYTQIYDLGGLNTWTAQGFPVE